MNREKRKEILKILGSGWSAVNISSFISHVLKQPEGDVLRIIQNLGWDRKRVLTAFNNFSEAHTKMGCL